jgi:hypothetical protein
VSFSQPFVGIDFTELVEFRRDAAKLVRMLIPTFWDDFDEFYAEVVEDESRPVIATAKAVALVKTVMDTSPPAWSRKIRLFAPMITIETVQFWKKIGSRDR